MDTVEIASVADSFVLELKERGFEDVQLRIDTVEDSTYRIMLYLSEPEAESKSTPEPGSTIGESRSEDTFNPWEGPDIFHDMFFNINDKAVEPIQQKSDYEGDIKHLHSQLDDLRHCVDKAIASINNELKAMRNLNEQLQKQLEKNREEVYHSKMDKAYVTQAKPQYVFDASKWGDGFWHES